MTEKIIMVVFVAVLAIFAVMLFKDARGRDRGDHSKKPDRREHDKNKENDKKKENAEAVKEALAKWKKVIFPKGPSGSTVLSGAPTIYVRVPGQKYYVSKKMDKKVFTIGRSSDNDIVLDDPTVSAYHAKIVRHKDRWGAFYFFKNMSPTNETHYYNQEKFEYEILKDKETIDLEEKEAFYIGEYKIVIETPQDVMKANEDELEVEVERKNTKSDSQKVYEGKNKSASDYGTKIYDQDDDSKIDRRTMHREKYSSKRMTSQRDTTEDELNSRF